MKTWTRRWLLPLHRLSAMTFGLVLVLSAVTGACIAFRPQLEVALNPELITAPTCAKVLPIDEFAAQAQRLRPDAELDYIRIIAKPIDRDRMHAVMIRYIDQNFVYFDPCSGQLLGQRHRYGGVLGTIERIHRWRFIQDGSLVTGSMAIVSVFMFGMLGPLLAYRLRAKSNLLTFRQGLTGGARLLDIHKTVGLYAAIFIVLMALTGLPQAFDWYRQGIYTLTGSEKPKPPVPVNAALEDRAPRPYETLWRQGLTLVGDTDDALMHFQSDPRKPVDMFAISAQAPHANARALMWFDRYTGATLKHIPYEESSLGFKLYFWTLSWHTGKLGGWPVQLLMLIGALSVPLLFATGVSSLVRRARSKRGQHTRTPAMEDRLKEGSAG